MTWNKYADRAFRIACLRAAQEHIAEAIDALEHGFEEDGRLRLPSSPFDQWGGDGGVTINHALWAVWSAWRGEDESGRNVAPGRTPNPDFKEEAP